MDKTLTYAAFLGFDLISRGSLEHVVLEAKRKRKPSSGHEVLIFSDSTGQQVDFDLAGSEKDLVESLRVYLTPKTSSPATGPGRPKLGVVGREVSLLPRHWEWLSTQAGGTSATLRRLVDEARKASEGAETLKQAQNRTFQFMSAIAGNLPNYEEALRSLFRKDRKSFLQQIQDWSPDLRSYILEISERAFQTRGR